VRERELFALSGKRSLQCLLHGLLGIEAAFRRGDSLCVPQRLCRGKVFSRKFEELGGKGRLVSHQPAMTRPWENAA
jgi:hypothetical protein